MVIRVLSFIEASPDVCFDAHRNLGLHVESAASTGERVASPKQTGLLELDEEVTFEARHFGVCFRLTSKIVEFERPHRFVDEMQRGPFGRMRHVHTFDLTEGGTKIADEIDFASPLGPLGWIADRLFVGRHLARFLRHRNAWLKGRLEQTDPFGKKGDV